MEEPEKECVPGPHKEGRGEEDDGAAADRRCSISQHEEEEH